MSTFDDLARVANSPFGRMMIGIVRDAFNNHIYPYMKDNMVQAMKPVEPMSETEQQQYAKEEFATVDDFDVQAQAKEVPEPDSVDDATRI